MGPAKGPVLICGNDRARTERYTLIPSFCSQQPSSNLFWWSFVWESRRKCCVDYVNVEGYTPLYCSKITRTKYIALICFHTVSFILSDSLVQLASSANRPNLPTSLLYDLHWLSISSRVQYKIHSSHVLPHCLWYSSSISELLHLYSPSRSLHSASDTGIFRVPRMGRTLGERFFQYIRPVIRNSLPPLFILFHSLLSKNRKPVSSLLHTDLSFSFSYCQPITSNVRCCSVCVCVCVCLCVSVCLCVCVSVCVWSNGHIGDITQ